MSAIITRRPLNSRVPRSGLLYQLHGVRVGVRDIPLQPHAGDDAIRRHELLSAGERLHAPDADLWPVIVFVHDVARGPEQPRGRGLTGPLFTELRLPGDAVLVLDLELRGRAGDRLLDEAEVRPWFPVAPPRSGQEVHRRRVAPVVPDDGRPRGLLGSGGRRQQQDGKGREHVSMGWHACSFASGGERSKVPVSRIGRGPPAGPSRFAQTGPSRVGTVSSVGTRL